MILPWLVPVFHTTLVRKYRVDLGVFLAVCDEIISVPSLYTIALPCCPFLSLEFHLRQTPV